MLKRVDKYLTKFDNSEALFKELYKKSLINAPIKWDKLISKVDKTGSLAYIFVSKSHIFGFYHY